MLSGVSNTCERKITWWEVHYSIAMLTFDCTVVPPNSLFRTFSCSWFNSQPLGLQVHPFASKNTSTTCIYPTPIFVFFIMISSCIHQGKGRWAMTQSSFQSSTMAIRPWWHVQWWVRRWEWDSFSYAQVQLVGTTSIQTMLHNTLWVGANVIVVPKF